MPPERLDAKALHDLLQEHHLAMRVHVLAKLDRCRLGSDSWIAGFSSLCVTIKWGRLPAKGVSCSRGLAPRSQL